MKGKIMEKWKKVINDCFGGKRCETLLTISENDGLQIELSNSEKKLKIVFGNAQAIRFLDERLVQNFLYDSITIDENDNTSFDGIMYEITNGEFNNFIDKISYGMSKELAMKHYIIITQNYNIEILTQWKPDIICE